MHCREQLPLALPHRVHLLADGERPHVRGAYLDVAGPYSTTRTPNYRMRTNRVVGSKRTRSFKGFYPITAKFQEIRMDSASSTKEYN